MNEEFCNSGVLKHDGIGKGGGAISVGFIPLTQSVRCDEYLSTRIRQELTNLRKRGGKTNLRACQATIGGCIMQR